MGEDVGGVCAGIFDGVGAGVAGDAVKNGVGFGVEEDEDGGSSDAVGIDEGVVGVDVDGDADVVVGGGFEVLLGEDVFVVFVAPDAPVGPEVDEEGFVFIDGLLFSSVVVGVEGDGAVGFNRVFRRGCVVSLDASGGEEE